jgi:hypothetical protein
MVTKETLKELTEETDLFFKSERGVEFIENLTKKREIQLKWYECFDNWLKQNDFDNLLLKVILKHDDEYRERCYNKGIEPYPNNILELIFDYVVEHCEPLKKVHKAIQSNFYNHVFKFKGYYFQIIMGQGTVYCIWNVDDKELLFSI